MQDDSHIKLGKRVKKSKAHPFGWEYSDKIPADEVCIVALPGSDADNSKKANGFAKMVADIMTDKKIPIYSVEYDLAGRYSIVDREALLNHFNQGNPNSILLRKRHEDFDYIPQYIKELYNKVFTPRLQNEDGSKISISKICQNLNKITFINHCQGSTVSFQLERLLNEDLEKRGFSEAIRNHILKQVHNVDVAPVIPYGITKTTTFKFASLADDKVTSVNTQQLNYVLKRQREHNRFLEGINGNETERKAGNRPFVMNYALFRPTANETCFAINNFYPKEIQNDPEMEGIEHTFACYSDKEDEDRTKQGDMLSQTLHTVVNWLAENSKKNQNEFTELPDFFKEQRFSRFISYAQSNRYDFITKEIKLKRSRTSSSANIINKQTLTR